MVNRGDYLGRICRDKLHYEPHVANSGRGRGILWDVYGLETSKESH